VPCCHANITTCYPCVYGGWDTVISACVMPVPVSTVAYCYALPHYVEADGDARHSSLVTIACYILGVCYILVPMPATMRLRVVPLILWSLRCSTIPATCYRLERHALGAVVLVPFSVLGILCGCITCCSFIYWTFSCYFLPCIPALLLYCAIPLEHHAVVLVPAHPFLLFLILMLLMYTNVAVHCFAVQHTNFTVLACY
jgi:hypothetical protein